MEFLKKDVFNLLTIILDIFIIFCTPAVKSANASLLIDTALSVANQSFYDRMTLGIWNDVTSNKDDRKRHNHDNESEDKQTAEVKPKAASKLIHETNKLKIDYVKEFLQRYMGKVFLAKPSTEDFKIDVKKFDRAIVFAENVHAATQLLKIFKNVMTPVRMILIFTTTIDKDSLNKITETAWNNDVGDIIILAPGENEEATARGWTYFPYHDKECGNTRPVEQRLKDIKFRRKFSNFHQCPVRVTLLPLQPYLIITKQNETVATVGGLDGELLNLILDKLNASMLVVNSDDHGGFGTYKNGKATGSFADLVNREADILIPALVMTFQRYSAAQISIVYETVDAVWFGPNRREVYAWAKVFLPFYSIFTAYLVLSFIIFVITTKAVRKYALCHPGTSKGIFLKSFILFLGQEVRFETKCGLVNSMFAMWLWFCMVMRIAYQGQLVDGLQKVILEPPLGTFEEAVKVLEGYGGEEVFKDYVKPAAADKYEVIDVSEMGPRIKDIGNGKRFLIVADILVLEVHKVQVQVLDEAVFRTPVCVHMRPGWPAADEVRQVITNLVETGLIQKVNKDFEYEIKRTTSSIPQVAPLSMTKLGALFFGLIAMFLVCFLIFCGELISLKYDFKSIFSKFK